LTGPTLPSLSWSEVASCLEPARHYWLHTTNHRSGAPDASPVWGVVVDGVLYLYTGRVTVKARNVAGDPRALVHLESGADVVIVHGELEDLGSPSGSRAVVAAFAAKYRAAEEQPFLPSSDPGYFDVLYRLRPLRASRWSLPDTEASTRRWVAGLGSATA
jgi:hypothetical protein